MIQYILLIAVFVVLLLLFIPIHRLAKRKAEIPRLWEGILLLLWTGIWLGVNHFRAVWAGFFGPSFGSGGFIVAIGMVMSLAAYLLIWLLLRRRPNQKRFERKLNEIGRKNEQGEVESPSE